MLTYTAHAQFKDINRREDMNMLKRSIDLLQDQNDCYSGREGRDCTFRYLDALEQEILHITAGGKEGRLMFRERLQLVSQRSSIDTRGSQRYSGMIGCSTDALDKRLKGIRGASEAFRSNISRC